MPQRARRMSMNTDPPTPTPPGPKLAAGAASAERPWRRSFWSLIVTQFQGAFSDNAYRMLVTFLVIGMTDSSLGALPRADRMALVGALFALPFILFSMAGGYLADRFSKRTVTIGTKLAEILIMTLASLGLWLGHPVLLLGTVFLMGTQSAFFGPSKYGLLPELLPEPRLSWGNGILELGTFLAIIGGTIAGGWVFETFKARPAWGGVGLIGLACLGACTSLGIARVPAAAPTKRLNLNFLGELASQIRHIRRDRVLWLAVIGNTYFFFLGALVQQYNVLAYGKDLLGLSEGQITLYLMSAMAVGIGLGSVAAGYLSGRKIEYGLIPLGSIGMTGFGLVLGTASLSVGGTVAMLAAHGFFAGFFVVPIAALIQHRPGSARKGAVLGAANLLSFVGIFLAAGAYAAAVKLAGLTPKEFFLVTSALTLGGTLFVCALLPDALLRLCFWALTHSVYRIKVVGREHIPGKGGALFVCNHLSLIDAFLLLASTDRFVRFIMFKGMYEKPLIKPFADILRVIPISSQVRPREMIAALREANTSIKRGEVVCIFAEGQITRIGQLLPFKRGFQRIMVDVRAPIIPVAVDGVWGSIFSFAQGRFYWKLPRRLHHPVTIQYGAPLPATATHLEVRQAVQDLQAGAWQQRKAGMRLLHRAFINTARHHPRRFAMADATVPRLGFAAALGRTIFLAKRLARVWRGQETVGLLLPPSVAAALVNWAAWLLGKVPVNLNYTVSPETLASCVRQCGLRSVVTSKKFLEKVKLTVPCDTVLVEDLAAQPRVGEKLFAAFATWLLPASWLERILGGKGQGSIDDLATVIFSSGSTGEPKGVMLTHYNVASNIEQIGQVFSLGRQDRVLGILPFFHSFGFTGTVCLPGALGVGVVYHPNPLEAAAVGELTREHAVTFLLATPTFLRLYLRGCEAEAFGSLRLVVAGAEKLPGRVADAFEEKFGVRPVEGYGCTECAPVVAVNTRDYRAAGFRQVGAKRGKIGHPLPGMSVRIVDPNTGEPLPVGAPGLLLVCGPNVMKGYLGRPDLTAEVLRDGWYATGDIAVLDEDGFLQITDRLSRFSKIGGEMVPHVKVEETLHELAACAEPCFAVAGVPDEKEGERLVVLHTLPEERLKPCLEKLAHAGLPNLWAPQPAQFFRVEELPRLGTGKMDLRKVRELAIGFATQAAAAKRERGASPG